MTKNPFEIFGLSPDMVGALSEKELFAVLKAMYRAYQKSVHPDVANRRRAGNIERAVELNLAFEALNLDKNPVAFRRHRKSFVARRPKSTYQKSLALEKRLLIQQGREARLAEAYFQRLANDYGWPVAEPDKKGQPSLAGGSALFPLKNVRLGLLDVAINQNLKMVSWSVGSNYKEMKFDAEGNLSVRPVGRSRFNRAAFIHLIGAVPSADVELLPLLERPRPQFFKAPALNASIGANGPSISVLNRIQPGQFKSNVLVHLKPLVTERSYLFSFNRPEFEDSGCLTLEGMVVKIEKLSGQ